MIERTEERLELCPERIVADTVYGSAEMRGEGDRATHSGFRQIGPDRRHLLARRLPNS
jgi:hypothetical protein